MKTTNGISQEADEVANHVHPTFREALWVAMVDAPTKYALPFCDHSLYSIRWGLASSASGLSWALVARQSASACFLASRSLFPLPPSKRYFLPGSLELKHILPSPHGQHAYQEG